MSDFSPIYEDNVAPESFSDLSPEHPESFKLPEYAKGYSKADALKIGTGRGLSKTAQGLNELGYRALKGLAWHDPETRKAVDNELKNSQYENEQNDKYWNQGIANQLSPVKNWAKGGELTGQVLPSLLLPGYGGSSLVSRAVGNGLINGAYEAGTTPGSWSDRALHGGLGTLGAGLGSAGIETMGKGVNAIAGKWEDPVTKKVNDLLVGMGLKPRIGDLTKPNKSTLVRSGENALETLPWGHQKHLDNVERLRSLVVPNDDTGVNTVTQAVRNTDEGVGNRSGEIWQPFKDYVTQNNIPGLRPTELKATLTELLKHDKNFINKLPDDIIKSQLQNIVDTPLNKLKSIPVLDYNELRKSLGALTPSIKAISQAVPGSAAIVDEQLPIRFGELLKGVENDMSNWGTYTATGDAYDLFKDANNTWKSEILPWYNSDIAYKLRKVDTFGAPKTADIIGSEPDTQSLDKVGNYLTKYGPVNNADVYTALNKMKRASQDLGDIPPRHISVPSFLAAAGDVSSLGLPSTGLRSLETEPGKAWYFGNSSNFMPNDLSSDIVSPVLGNLTKLGIGTGREEAPAQLSVLKLINDLIKSKGMGGDSSEDVNMGQLNQAGTRGNNPIPE